MSNEYLNRQERLQLALIAGVIYAGQLAGKDGDHDCLGQDDIEQCIAAASRIAGKCLGNNTTVE